MDYHGTAFSLLVVGSLLAWPLSLLLLKAYKARVLRLMRRHSGAQTRDRYSSTPPRVIAEDTGRIAVSHLTSSTVRETNKRGRQQYLWAINARRRTALIYSFSGLLFAAIMAGVSVLTLGGFVLMRWLVLLCIFSWPIVISLNLVLVSTPRVKAVTVGIFLLVLLLVFSIGAARSPETSVAAYFGSFAIINIPPSLVFLAFLNQKIRAAGPMVLAFVIISLLGAVVGLSLLDVASASTDSTAVRSFFTIAASLGLSAAEIVVLFAVLGLAVFGVLGWLANRWIENLYVSKKLNDQSLVIDSLWLLFGSFHAIGVAFTHPAWILASIAGFVAYRIAVIVGFKVGAATTDLLPQKANLLFLRVFSLGKRSETSFESIAKTWSYLGNIQMIAGPDLATTTVEPHEFLNFLSGRIERDFILDDHSLALKLEHLDVDPDFDHRYRVNDFFCYDNVWRAVLLRLVHQADAVFMDARGYSSANSGAAFEINELVNAVPFSKVVLAVDATTDLGYLQQTLAVAWNTASADSPNRADDASALRLYHFHDSKPIELAQLTRLMVGSLS